MDILIESMTKANYGDWFIRCWRQETQYNKQTVNETQRKIKEVVGKYDGEQTAYKIAEHLLNVVRMNAVEVLDEAGQGCVLYKNWP